MWQCSIMTDLHGVVINLWRVSSRIWRVLWLGSGSSPSTMALREGLSCPAWMKCGSSLHCALSVSFMENISNISNDCRVAGRMLKGSMQLHWQEAHQLWGPPEVLLHHAVSLSCHSTSHEAKSRWSSLPCTSAVLSSLGMLQYCPQVVHGNLFWP